MKKLAVITAYILTVVAANVVTASTVPLMVTLMVTLMMVPAKLIKRI